MVISRFRSVWPAYAGALWRPSLQNAPFAATLQLCGHEIFHVCRQQDTKGAEEPGVNGVKNGGGELKQ